MNHAYISQALQSIKLNGREVGEIGIFGTIAGVFGVPVALVTGDAACCRVLPRVAACCREARDWMANVEIASVKSGINRFAAQCLSQQKAHELIQLSAKNALQSEVLGQIEPLLPPQSTRFELEFTGSQCADSAARVPGVLRVEDRIVAIENGDYLAAFASLRLGLELASSTFDRDY